MIISALIGAAVSICLAIYNSVQQKKWDQKKLDADLKARARIDWIQKVREHTAELLSIYYGILNETEPNQIFEKIQEAKMHSDILILYFGDSNHGTEQDYKKELSNTVSNEKKNDAMVTLISDLFERINKYYRAVVNNELGLLKEQYERAREIMYDYPLHEEYVGDYIAENGEEIPQFEPTFDPKLEEQTEIAKEQLSKYRESIEDIKKTNE